MSTPASASTGTAAHWSGAMGDPLRLVLLRHGQTEHSVRRCYSGRGDPDLTETGLRQAEAAARRLGELEGIAAVVSSPLGRASQTARAVSAATGAPLEIDQGLVELDFGEWEGLTFGEAARRYPDEHRAWLRDPSVPTPGGESFEQVHERVLASLGNLVERHGGQTVVLVSHVTPIKTLLRIGLDAGPSVLYRCHLDLAGISRVDFYPDGNASVTLVNDTTHLR
ncbi:histidine phosphatase family protein [Sciscionella sediminilitoris]|uniref:histidine phosphatase family protein n=1 Tax=Sciscionella sediminilitoris TaxID=1445613 RepID=UPI00055F4045